MSVLGALGFGVVGAVVAASMTWRGSGEELPWSTTIKVGTGAYRQHEVERSIVAPLRVRFATVVAWFAFAATFLRAPLLVLELLATKVATAGYRDCAELPCEPYSPPPTPSLDASTVTAVVVYLVGIGALLGALARWAIYARKNVVEARNTTALAACGLCIVLALFDALTSDSFGIEASFVHALVLIVTAPCLALARRGI